MKRTLLSKFMLLLCIFIVGGGNFLWAAEVTFTFGNAPSKDVRSVEPVTKNDVITVQVTKNDGSNPPSFGSYLNLNNKNKLTISCYDGHITQVVLTYRDASYAAKITQESFNSGLYSYTDQETTGTWTSSSDINVLEIVNKNSTQSQIARIVITYTLPTVVKPLFSSSEGAVEKGTTVTLYTITEGATIHYTLDESTPTSGSPTYTTPIEINSATTIKAIAIKDEVNSNVATAEYTIKQVETPTFTVAEGDVLLGTSVEISTATDGATIHYTTDGTTPTSSSPTYSDAISINQSMTIKAIAIKSNWDDSEVASAEYTGYAAHPGLSIDFEATKLFQYTDWVFSNIGIHSTGTTAHGGSKWGSNVASGGGGASTASITTKNIIANPGTFTCYISKETTNTSESSWKIQTSSNGDDWTDVATKSAIEMKQGEWQEFTADLSDYKNVYVRLSYGSNTARRAVDDIILQETQVPVTIASSGFSTICNANALNLASLPTGLTAYKVETSNVHPGYVILTEVNTAVKANTPLILHGTGGASYNIPTTTSDNDISSSNALKQGNGTLSYEEGKSKYVLQGGVFKLVVDGTPASVPSTKAYLELTGGLALANELTLDFSDATGVKEVTSYKDEVKGEYYNLAGQRVAQPTKGLYIVNGKKVMMK